MPNLERLVMDKHPLPEWAVFTELRRGTGYGREVDKRADVAAFHTWPSKKGYRVAYEIKRARSDFIRELNKPTKREWLEQFFHETYFVITPGVCATEEIPESWGLYVTTKKEDKLRRVKIAQSREAEEIPPVLWQSILRRACHMAHEGRDRNHTFEGDVVTAEQLTKKIDDLVAERLSYDRACLDRAEKRFKEREAECRKTIDLCQGPLRLLGQQINRRNRFRNDIPTVEEVREWINQVSNGVNMHVAEQLERIQTMAGQVAAQLKAGA